MLPRDRAIQVTALLLVVLSLLGSAGFSTALTAEAGRAQLSYTDAAQEGDPPEVALGIAMGAFRGLFVNYLWIRANKLKEQGKFYEAIELSSAITRLQPRFPRVWVFHAWNMAYNISVATNTAAERWTWVKAGLELLRDQAIPRNPNDVLLHKELAWIYIHKIQGWADDANHFYKRELAKEWTIVLGTPPARTGSTEENTRTYADWLLPVVEARDTLEAVIEEEQRAAGENAPRNPDGTPRSLVRELADRLRNEAKMDLGIDLLRYIEFRKALGVSPASTRFGGRLSDAARNAALETLLDDPALRPAWDRLIPFIRHRIIVHDYHMEPARMLRYTRKYGPLDWRHPATHSLYWATAGVEEGMQRQGLTEFDTINTDRLVTHSMQELWRFGEIQFDLVTGEYFALTDFNFVDQYEAVLDALVKRAGIVGDPMRPYNTYSAGYTNFLREVIRTCWNRGEYALAEKYHAKFRNFAGINIHDQSLKELLSLPLAEFVREQLKDQITIPYVAVQEMESALIEAFTRGLLMRQPEVFKRNIEYAKAARDAYLKEQSERTTPDPEADRMARFVGRSFTEMASMVFLRLLAGGTLGGPDGGYRLGPNQAADMFQRAPAELQQAVYDDLVRVYTQRDRFPPDVLAVLFPEPSGMEAYRAARAEAQAASEAERKKALQFEQK